MDDGNLEEVASTSSDFTSVQWRQRLERHDKIKEIVHLEHIRSFKIDDQVYRAVIENNIENLDGFRNYFGHLNEENYFDVMRTVLQVEEAYRAINMRKFDLFKQTLALEKTQYYEKGLPNYGPCFKVIVKNLASEGLFLMPGDSVVLHDQGSDSYQVNKIGKVRAEEVLFPVERHGENQLFLDKLLDIFFVSDGLTFRYLEEGLDRAESNQSIRRRILDSSRDGFSEFGPAKIHSLRSSCPANKSLFDLDNRQYDAVKNILAAYWRPKPYILIGLPGTGKTKTLAEAIAQIYFRDKDAKVLFCASSDCVTQMENKLKQLDEMGLCEIYRLARSDNYEARKQSSRIHLVATAMSHCFSGDIRYDYVFIDEADCASDLECLLPIGSLKDDGCLVLAGDPTQFKPIFQCKQLFEMGLGRSLLERVLEFDSYKFRPKERRFDSRFITELFIAHGFNQSPITTSYRQFYGNQLNEAPIAQPNERPPSIYASSSKDYRTQVGLNECWQRHNNLKKLGLFNRVSSFMISEDVYRAVMKRNIKSLPAIRDFIRSGNLNDENYRDVMKAMLKIEEAYCAIDMRKFDMFYRELFFSEIYIRPHAKKRIFLYGVEVEGLTTGDLHLMPNDIMVMHDPTTKIYKHANIERIKHDIVLVPIEQNEEMLVFIQNRLNISFISRGSIWEWCKDAVDRRKNIINRMILESAEGSFDGFKPPKISLVLPLGLDADREDDKFQDKAVEGILRAECRPRPYIVFGPPGTGKSYTLVEAMVQIYSQNKHARVLYCASSNICVDHMMDKLIRVVGSGVMERFRAGEKIAESFPRLKAARIHLTTNVRSHSLRFKYDYIFIDEASHANEPESLLPICLLRPDGCLVLAGDPEQLGPVFNCEQICDLELDKSLLERMFKFDMYKRDSTTNQYNDKYITKLLRCYRCDPRVMTISNRLFYDNELECLNRTPPSILKIMKLSGPLQFVHVDGHESRSEDSTSLYNMEEVYCCVGLIIRLCHLGLEPHQIGVISPYKLHANEIAKELERQAPNLFKKCLVDTFENSSGAYPTLEYATDDGDYCKIASVDAFQGNEREVIILSTVRSNPNGKLDFIEERRRFNVALTRAKWLQIVVGHQNVLEKAKYWSEYIKHAAKNEIYKFQ